MIDQRVSQGIKSNFFNQEALTTTIPAQLVKKFKIPIVPVFIERVDNINFKIVVKKPINFESTKSTKEIKDTLNKLFPASKEHLLPCFYTDYFDLEDRKKDKTRSQLKELLI